MAIIICLVNNNYYAFVLFKFFYKHILYTCKHTNNNTFYTHNHPKTEAEFPLCTNFHESIDLLHFQKAPDGKLQIITVDIGINRIKY